MTAIKDHDKTGNVTLIDPKPAVDPWPIITDEARTAWFEQQNVLRSGYPDDHGVVVGWYEEAWERVNDRPAPPWVRAITFSPSCWDGACWECTDSPQACGCGHHRPGGRAPCGPVKPADPLPAVAAFLGIAKPAPEAEPVAEEPAPVAEPEPAAGEPAPTDATAVLLAVAAEQAAVNETAAPEATTVMPVTEAPAEAVPVVEDEDGGETDVS